MTLLDSVSAGPFNVLYTTAIGAAFALAYREGRRNGWPAETWLLALTAWAIGGILGSVVTSWAVHGQAGGKTILGGIAGSLVALAVVSRSLGLSPARAMDTLATAIPTAGVIVRIGCYLAGCCGGSPTDLPWGITSAESTGAGLTHPVQLYDAALCGLVAILINVRRERFTRPGYAAMAMVAGLAASRFALQFVRENHVGTSGLDFVQWAMLGVVAAVAVIVAFSRTSARPISARTLGQVTAGRFASVTGCVVLVSLIASPLLSPLETAIAFMAASIAGLTLLSRLRAEMPGLAPVSTAAVMVLQTSEGVKAHRFYDAGIGYARSEYNYNGYDSGENCGSPATLDYDRRHSMAVTSLLGGYRVDSTKDRGYGVRGQMFFGTDHMGAAVVRIGSPSKPQPHSERITGGAVMFDYDRRWIGLSGGLAAGSWPSIANEPGDGQKVSAPFFLTGVRVGIRSRLFVDVQSGTAGPAAPVSPVVQAAVGIGNKRGDRFRFGGSGQTAFGEAVFMATDQYQITALIGARPTEMMQLAVRKRLGAPRQR